ncbi:hypothetical protein L6R50_02015 [Myxococcota bacterium]|nr:hypothetical protein [Myxococcota bacterium]
MAQGRSSVLVVLTMLAAGGPARAATLTVDPEQGPYLDIASAVAAAAPGDEVVVAPGTYQGAVDLAYGDPTLPESDGGFPLPPVVLRSRDGASVTTIESGGADFAVRIQPGGTVSGFTLRGSGDGVRAIGGTGPEHVFDIRHNDVRTTGDHGIRVFGGASHVVANAVSGAAKAGIAVAGEARVVANLVTGVDGAGILLEDGGAGAWNNQVCDCRIGVRAGEGFAGEIAHNGVVFAGVAGVELQEGSATARVAMNAVGWSEAGLSCALPPGGSGWNDWYEIGGLSTCDPNGSDLDVAPDFVEVHFLERSCDGLDMRLKGRSGLANTGDPNEGDPDGTRADIGPFGGPESVYWDLDGDGDPFGEDCDDRDALAAHGLTEVCDDSRDNDCDGWVDDPEDECPYPDLEGLYCASGGAGGPGGLALPLGVACLWARSWRRRPGRGGWAARGAPWVVALLLLALPGSARAAEARGGAPGAPGREAPSDAPVPRADRLWISLRGGYLRFGLAGFGTADVGVWGHVARTPLHVGGGFLAAWRRDSEDAARWIPLGRIGVGLRGVVAPVVRGVFLMGAWNPTSDVPGVGGGAELLLIVRPGKERAPGVEIGGIAGVVDGRPVFLGCGGIVLTI